MRCAPLLVDIGKCHSTIRACPCTIRRAPLKRGSFCFESALGLLIPLSILIVIQDSSICLPGLDRRHLSVSAFHNNLYFFKRVSAIFAFFSQKSKE
jgi:hypothetical protein